ncbi:MAG: hypothetical protein Tp1100SUR639781_40 [Prokaryotic dsDNA virus sp.]|nr:MAG: hypothetical protein Tp1100SUR639781_40 [Prokaryotic dsDNA virus sp.]|tara:strand:+ start:1896 stop:2066 length:171 start_codon:yes stop_codon:yes gene_type:complete
MTDFAYLWWEMNRPNVTKEEYEIALKQYIAKSFTREEQIKILHEYVQGGKDDNKQT